MLLRRLFSFECGVDMVAIFRSPELSSNRQLLSNPLSKSMARFSKPAAVVAPANEIELTVKPVATSISEEKLREITETVKTSVWSQLKSDAEKAKELARQRGLLEGHAEGVAEAKREFATELQRIRSLSEQLRVAFETNLSGVEDVIVTIAYGAVCRLMGEVAHTKSAVESIVKQSLRECASAENVLIRLHPDDLSILREHGAIDLIQNNAAALKWVSDESLAIGGCVVEVDGGSLDARLTSQLEALKQCLLAARAAR